MSLMAAAFLLPLLLRFSSSAFAFFLVIPEEPAFASAFLVVIPEGNLLLPCFSFLSFPKGICFCHSTCTPFAYAAFAF